MATSYKLVIQNAKLLLKTGSNGLTVAISGIKDSLTGSGSIDSNNLVDWRILHYADTAANIANDNPILGTGQIGIETDDLSTAPKFKIGDGTTEWNDLPYFSSGGGSQSLQDVINLDNHVNGEIIKSQSGHSSIILLFDVLTTTMSDGLNTTVVEQTPTGLNITSPSMTKNTVELATIDIITQTITNGVLDKAPSEDAVYDALAPLLVSSKIFMYKNFK